MGLVLGLGALGCSDNLTPQPELEAYQGSEIEELECIPNLDGRIEAHELRAALDVPVNYRVTPAGAEVPVDLRGLRDDGGARVWDWRYRSPDERSVSIRARPLSQAWFADRFSSGEFVTPLDTAGRQDAVYSIEEDGLMLHGFASSEEDPAEGQTLFVYQDPVTVYPFPVEPGVEWVSTGVVENGTFRGLPYAGRDIYEGSVEETGELWLPDIRFEEAHKVTTTVVVQPAVGESTQRRQVSFLFECFGEVARATSLADESSESFEVASEIRRLGF